jgi:hypothetical protein
LWAPLSLCAVVYAGVKIVLSDLRGVTKELRLLKTDYIVQKGTSFY